MNDNQVTGNQRSARWSGGVSPLALFCLLIALHARGAYCQPAAPSPWDDGMTEIDRAVREDTQQLFGTAEDAGEPEQTEPLTGPRSGDRFLRPGLQNAQSYPDASPRKMPDVERDSNDTPVTSPMAILKQARRVTLREGEAPQPIRTHETEEIAPPTSPRSIESPSSPAPDAAAAPSSSTGEPWLTPTPTPAASRSAQQKEKKPGFIRGVFGKIPVIGPKLVPQRHKSDETRQGTPSETPPTLYPPTPEPGMADDSSSVPRLSPSARNYAQPPSTIRGTPATGTARRWFVPGQTMPGVAITTSSGGIRIAPHDPPEVRVGTPIPAKSRMTPRVSRTPADSGAMSTPVAPPQPTQIPQRVVSRDDITTRTILTVEEAAPAERADSAADTPPPSAPDPAMKPRAKAMPTSVTLEPNDLAMPNPAREENEVIRKEFVKAIEEARGGDRPAAARRLRDYAANHPSSGLAPRALFLAVIFDPGSENASEAMETLREKHPKSPYVKELERRLNMDEPRVADVETSPTETTEETISRLELALASEADPGKAVSMRQELGRLYLGLRQYARAAEILAPALEDARGTRSEPRILDLISQAELANGDSAEASKTLSELLERFPDYGKRPAVRLNFGLANEGAGQYQRAMAEYRQIIELFPKTVEAATATSRLADLQKLTE